MSKLENTIQQYEFVQNESESIVKQIFKLFGDFNEKIIQEILNCREDSLKELFSYFFLIISGEEYVSYEQMKGMIDNNSLIFQKDVNKDTIEKCFHFYLNYDQFRTTIIDFKKYWFIADITKLLVDYYIKKSLLNNLYHTNIKKNSKLSDIKDKITTLEQKQIDVTELLKQMEKELVVVDKNKDPNFINLLIKKYYLLEKYKIITIPEGEGILIKNRSKYKNYHCNIDFLLQTRDINIDNLKGKNKIVKLFTEEHLKKSRNQPKQYKDSTTIGRNEVTGNTDFIDKFKTNIFSFNYNEISLKNEDNTANLSMNKTSNNFQENKNKLQKESFNRLASFKQSRPTNNNRSSFISHKKESKINIEGPHRSNCFWCC